MRYSMDELSSVLGLPNRLFLLREKGAEAYRHLRTCLDLTVNGEPLLLVFPDNQLVDASFADESIVRLGHELIAGMFGQRCLLLEGLTEDSIHNIEAAIHLQNLRIMFVAVESSGKWSIIGHLEPSLREVLGILASRKLLRTAELADLLHVATNTASNRLKRLYDLRLTRREHEITETGLQYVYSFWNWAED